MERLVRIIKMKKPKLSRILRKGKAIFLAYDQGLEHGPKDFNDKNVNPAYIIKVAKKGKFTGLVLQKGIARKYKSELKKAKIPLILKLNGKTNLVKGDPISAQIATVKEAVKLGASAVGFTIYLGSIHEEEMLEEFAKIEREAHSKGLPVIVWIYPRGKSVKRKSTRELMAYAARTGLEIGADVIKIKYNGNLKDLKWAVKNAGKTKIVIAGGIKKDEKLFLRQVREIMRSGCIGLAIGRNIWQNKEPLSITKKIKKIIFK
jgi:class I fructose-bisphosphate aldolase